MTLKIGNKVVYPNQGPCRIGAVVKKEFGGRPQKFYPLAILDDSGDVLFIPVDKVKTLGIRRLMEKSEVPKLLSRLSQQTETAALPTIAMNWKQRAIDNSALLASGSASDLAKIIGSLTELNETKALSPRDRQVLDKARKNLICEISEVIGESKSAAEEQLDDALKITKGRMRRSERHDLNSNFSGVSVNMKKYTA
jgi:RNA polymerase-interacting CarD/CdnL/TRCF family regulator